MTYDITYAARTIRWGQYILETEILSVHSLLKNSADSGLLFPTPNGRRYVNLGSQN